MKSMWSDLTHAWNHYGDASLIRTLCETATTLAVNAKCHFTLSLTYDPSTQSYINKMKYKIAGSNPVHRYIKPSGAQINCNVLSDRALEAAAGKAPAHGPEVRTPGSWKDRGWVSSRDQIAKRAKNTHYW